MIRRDDVETTRVDESSEEERSDDAPIRGAGLAVELERGR